MSVSFPREQAQKHAPTAVETKAVVVPDGKHATRYNTINPGTMLSIHNTTNSTKTENLGSGDQLGFWRAAVEIATE